MKKVSELTMSQEVSFG